MSRIHFHSEHHGTVDIWGVERAWLELLCGTIGERFHRMATEPPAEPGYEFDRYSRGDYARIMNTSLALGNDVFCLATRITCQCEVHGWFAGRDREWLAGLILQGLSIRVFRPVVRAHPTGWEELVAWLRSGEGDVVMSYSVTDDFPGHLYEEDDEGEVVEDRALTWKEAFEQKCPEMNRIGPDTVHGLVDHEKTMLTVFAGNHGGDHGT
jgi:hypothetical protein